jgi:hypothetical protein
MNNANAEPWWVSTAFWCGLMLAAIYATYMVYTRFYGEPSVVAGALIGGAPAALVIFIRSKVRELRSRP